MKEFLSSQLFSVIIGACLTLIASIIVGKKTYSNTLDEKIAEERISAYIAIYNMVSELNHCLGPQDPPSIPDECHLSYIRIPHKEYHIGYQFPTVFVSFSTFHQYKLKFSIILNKKRIFLSQPILNKLSYLDSYLSEIWEISNGKSDDYIQRIGFAFMNEIDNICYAIEDDIQDFFVNDKKRMRKSKFTSTYKYEKKQRNNSELFTLLQGTDNTIRFGELPLCSDCKYSKNCPLNNISNKSTNDSTDVGDTSGANVDEKII